MPTDNAAKRRDVTLLHQELMLVPTGYRDDDGVWHESGRRDRALEALGTVRRVVERYGRVCVKDTDYYAAAEILGIQEPPC